MNHGSENAADHGGGHIGHSNDSLLASADEMAGNYSPHTPGGLNTNLTASNNSSVARNGTSSNGESVDTVGPDPTFNYPIPADTPVWTQAVHPDSIQRLMSMENEASLETFPDSAKIYSHVNPETFQLPVESRVVCMKLDKLQDMRYAIKVGHMTNLPSCNERLNEIWKSRDGQRVYMMFSISGAKEFCAMAEVNSGVQTGSMLGWSKAGCTGIIDLTFIYVKDVPFKLINHIKHKGNGQPVANMWNSMLYHDDTGYQVAKIYIEHPVLSTMLINFRTEMQHPYKGQLRIPSSGQTGYSASSYGSNNRKSNDPRSATRVSLYRSGNRRQGNGNANSRRHEIQNQPWRQNGLQNFLKITGQANDSSPTPVASHRQGISGPTSNPSQSAASPPRFQLANNTTREQTPSLAGSGTSFTTADERLLANFPGFQKARQAEEAKKVQQQREAGVPTGQGIQPGFSAARAGPPFRSQQQPALTINTNWRNLSGNTFGAYQNNALSGPFQQQARVPLAPLAPPAPLASLAPRAPPFASQASSGMSVPFAHSHSYGVPTMPSMQLATNNSHLPSPATSSENPGNSFVSPTNDQSRPPIHGFSTPIAQIPQNIGFGRGLVGQKELTRSVPHSTGGSKQCQIARPFQHQPDNSVKRGSPIKHSQSMPLMIPPDAVESPVQRLRAQAAEYTPSHTPGNTKNRFASSPVVEDWVATTPTRGTFRSEQTPTKAQAVVPSSDAKFDEDRITRLLSKQEQHKYHEAQVQVLEVRIAILCVELGTNALQQNKKDESCENLLAEIETQRKYHLGRKNILEVQLKTAEKEHDEARGELAQETVDNAPISPSEPINSSEFTRPSDGFEEKIICPEYDETGRIIRSASKHGDDKPTHMSQVARHRRGGIYDPNREGFTGSFDARVVANVEGILASPIRGNVQPVASQQHANFRFLGGESIAAPTPQYGSSNDDRYFDNGSSFDNDSTNDIESQISVTEHDDDVFSPRGRFCYRTQPMQDSRDVSQFSHHGGIDLHDGYEYK